MYLTNLGRYNKLEKSCDNIILHLIKEKLKLYSSNVSAAWGKISAFFAVY